MSFHCAECGADVLEQCLCPPFDVPAGESGVLRDPEPPTPCDDCETTGQNCRAHSAPIWRQHPSAEGGQPDVDDELLARADWWSEILAAPVVTSDVGTVVRGVASALRRKRDELAEAETWQSAWEEEAYKNKRLERELAEARSHGEVLARGALTDAVHDPDGWVDLRILAESGEFESYLGSDVLVVLAPTVEQ